jgi:hypothetical protein
MQFSRYSVQKLQKAFRSLPPVADGNILEKEYSNQPPHEAAFATTFNFFKVRLSARREEKFYSRSAAASRLFLKNF